MVKLEKLCTDLPPYGQAHYFHRADAGADLVRCGFKWDWLDKCWKRDAGTSDEIRATVRWSEGFNRFYLSSI